MIFDPGNDSTAGMLLDVDAKALTRDDLVELVEDLQRALAIRLHRAAPAAARPLQSPAAVSGADFTLVFDGGSLGNPGLGYGSYEVVTGQGTVAAQQVKFGADMTNNQAEFRALIAGLEAIVALVGNGVADASVAVRGDSQLVIRGMTGEWKVKHPGLQPLQRQAKSLLDRFGSVDLAWHSRRESMKSFGH